MASFSLPNDFRTSLVQSSNYPVNLPRKGMTTYRSALEAYKKRLDEIERDLCLVEGRDEIDKDFEKSLVEYSVIWITSALYPYDKIMIT